MQGKLEELQAMYAEWPFFQSTFDLIEMVLAKADMRIASLYDKVCTQLWGRGNLAGIIHAPPARLLACLQMRVTCVDGTGYQTVFIFPTYCMRVQHS